MTAFFIFLVIALGIAFVANVYWPFLLSGATCILTGMIVFVNQLFMYLDLQKGTWESQSFLQGMAMIFKKETQLGAWVAEPQSFRGIHNFLDGTPLTLALILMGVFFIAFYMRKNQM